MNDTTTHDDFSSLLRSSEAALAADMLEISRPEWAVESGWTEEAWRSETVREWAQDAAIGASRHLRRLIAMQRAGLAPERLYITGDDLRALASLLD